ncbi:MAG: hypothetical protein ABI340_09515 [Nitrososphaera sp.]|jgi:hypothetical protein
MDYPVEVDSEGIKLKPDKMEIEKLYYCIYQEKVMLFYKDQNDMLNCYEIAEKSIVDEVKQSKPGEIENILEKYLSQKS